MSRNAQPVLSFLSLALFLVLLLFLSVSPVCSMTLYLNDNTTRFFTTPRLTYIGPSPPPNGGFDAFPIEGELFVTEEYEPNVDLNGKIMIYSLRGGQSQEDAARKFRHSGLRGLLTLLRVTTNYPGIGNWIRDGTRIPGLEFPLYEITESQTDKIRDLLKQQPIINVSIAEDPNPWDNVFFYGVPFFSIYLMTFSSVILLLAVYKLAVFVKIQGPQISVVQVVLAINIAGALIRIIWSGLDPLGCSRCSPLTTNFHWQQVGISLSYPLMIAGLFLIALYWHEMTKKSGSKINMFLDRYRWPFVAFVVFMTIFEIVTSTLRGYYYSITILLYIDGAMYVIAVCTVLIFFITTRIRLARIFEKLNRGLKSRSAERLKLATWHLTASIGIAIPWIVIIVILGATNVSWIPVGFVTLWTLFFTAVSCICLFQVLLIRLPKDWSHPWQSTAPTYTSSGDYQSGDMSQDSKYASSPRGELSKDSV